MGCAALLVCGEPSAPKDARGGRPCCPGTQQRRLQFSAFSSACPACCRPAGSGPTAAAAAALRAPQVLGAGAGYAAEPQWHRLPQMSYMEFYQVGESIFSNFPLRVFILCAPCCAACRAGFVLHVRVVGRAAGQTRGACMRRAQAHSPRAPTPPRCLRCGRACGSATGRASTTILKPRSGACSFLRTGGAAAPLVACCCALCSSSERREDSLPSRRGPGAG